MNILHEVADALEKLESIENNGRGIQCCKSIVFYLKKNDWDSAVRVANLETDKIRSYTDVYDFLLAAGLCEPMKDFHHDS